MEQKNKFLFIEFDEQESLLSAEWIPAEVGLEEVKNEMMKMLDMIRDCKPRTVIVDSRHYRLRKSEEIQYWINFKFIPKLIDIGIDKYAIVVNEETLRELASHEEPDPIDLSDFMTVKYFSESKDAEAWLKG